MKKKKKGGGLNYFRIFLALFLLLVLILGIVFFIQRSRTADNAVLKLEYGELDISDEFTALMIRNEKVFSSNASGAIAYDVEEGSILEQGDAVLKITLDDEVVAEETNRNKDVALSISRRALEIELSELREEVLSDIRYEKYDQAIALKREYKSKKNLLEKIGDASSSDEVAEGIYSANNEISIYTPLRGRISFVVDGFETPASLSNIYTFDFNRMGSDLTKESIYNTIVAKGDKIYKIIDDSSYYIAIKIPYSMDPEMYIGAENYTVYIGGASVKGSLYDSFNQGDASICIIRLNDDFPSFYTTRWQECKVVVGGYKGLIVPNEAMVMRDGVRGVYRVTPEKRAEFIAVKVLKEGEKNAIIQDSRFYNSTGDLVPTVEVGQVVVKDASGYKDGDLVRE